MSYYYYRNNVHKHERHESYLLREKAEWATNQALIATWLRGDFDDEIRYLSSPVSSHQGKKEDPG